MKYILIFIVCIGFSSLAKTKDLSVGWELWYPYQYHDENNQLVGVDIDSFNAIMNEAGLSYTAAEIPWKTHLHFIKTGKMDMAMGASWSKDREQYAYFSLPYRQETVKLFVRKGNAKKIALKQLKELAGSPYIIGVEAGYYYGKNYQELIKQSAFQANITEVIDLEQNVSLLLEGHLDGFLVDPNTMAAFINKYDFNDEFEQHSLEIYSADIFIMLSKVSSSKPTLDKINRAISSLQANGKLEKIIQTWNVSIKQN